MTPATTVRSNCSGCMEPFTLNIVNLTVVMTKPSNGRRGSLRVNAQRVVAEAVETENLIEWECPLCGYPESEEKK